MEELQNDFQAWCENIRQKKLQREKNIVEEQAVKVTSQYWQPTNYDDDDDDEESSITLRDIIISKLPPCIAITPILSTEEPVDSLIMEDEHLDTIPETGSDELIKSSVEDLVHTPSESDDYEAFFCDSEPDSGDFTMDSFVIKSPIPVEDGDSFLEKFETTPELETFKFDIEEKNSGSTTIHADISLPDLKCVYFKSEPIMEI
ncbi:hypothetical protein Tco_0370892 [Tanacetum coccineum]